MARSEKVVRRMLTTEEAAAYLGTTVRHVRRLVSDHELSRYKVGGRNRFRRRRPRRLARLPAHRGGSTAAPAPSSAPSVKGID